MKYVKLVSGGNWSEGCWFVKGTEVWNYNVDRRMTVEEFEKMDDCAICVRGIRKCDPTFPYENQYMEKYETKYKIDGEVCHINEFLKPEFVDDDGTEEILELIKDYSLL